MEAQYPDKIAVTAKHSNQGAESAFQKIILIAALAIVVLLVAIFLSLLFHALLSLKALGITFPFSKVWDPVSGTFGALPFLVGTLLT